MAAALRLVVYDRTDTRRIVAPRMTSGAPDGTSWGSPGLSPVWWAGTWLHRLTGAADAILGAASWDEALTWAAAVARERSRPIESLQLWGHGGWGFMRMGDGRLDAGSLDPLHAHASLIDGLRDALEGPDALVWFRCCSAFGNVGGQRFAVHAAERFGCRVAGHTYIIGPLQSGTRSVRPGASPTWAASEGVKTDAGGDLTRAKWSGPLEPATISFLRLGLPDGW